ncbi:MAG: PDZ domain-containing protein, partial [Gammaproteobacteria bacterium]
SAAERAGLVIGDVIVSIDSEAIEDAGALRNAIGLLRPGDKVSVGFIREGREQTIVAVLGEIDAPLDAQQRLADVDAIFEGAEFVTNQEARTDFNGVAGLLVLQVQSGSPAALRGLRGGDIITHINRQRVRNVTEAIALIESARSIILQVQRGSRGVLILMR